MPVGFEWAQCRAEARSWIASTLCAFCTFGVIGIASSVEAAPIELPIAGPTEELPLSFDLGDPLLINLDQPSGYSVTMTATGGAGFSNEIGDTLVVDGEIVFSPGPVADYAAGLLVISSLRSGTGTSTCPVTAARAPLAFDSESFSVGGESVDPVLTSDPVGTGSLCDDEGEFLLGILFDGEPDATQAFRFELILTDEMDLSEPFHILNDAYVVTPEPGTALLVGLGLAGLAARRTRME